MRDKWSVNDDIGRPVWTNHARRKAHGWRWEKIEYLLTTVQTDVLFEIELANGRQAVALPRSQNER